jgi:uncharacterized protein YfaS (alpha-2-macroglobulin family)
MRRVKGLRFIAVSAAFLAVNIAGILWIHHDLTRSPKAKVRVLAALPTQNLDSTDRLALVFDEPIAKPDQVGRPLDRSPFVVSPSVPGQWQWAATDRLEFVLEKPLLPGRVFTVAPASDLEMQSGRALVGPGEFQFRTRKLLLLDCRLLTAEQGEATFELVFNQPVHPQELLNRVQVRDAETPGAPGTLKVVSLVQEPSDKLVIRTVRPRSGKVSIRLDGALTGHGAELGLGDPVTRQLTVAPRFCLLRAEPRIPRLEKELNVELHFSHELGYKQTLPQITVAPEVKDLQVSRGHSSLNLHGPFEVGRRYKVTVPANLLASNNETLGEPQTATFEIPQRPAALRFPMSEGVLSPTGRMALDLESVNVGSVKVSGWRLHANNLASYLRLADTPGTSRLLPGQTYPLKTPRNVPTTMTLDLKDLLGQGASGIYRIAVHAEDGQWAQATAVVCLTDLAITAKRHREGYLAWVTSLKTARPVQGAKVTALTQNNQTVASAVTDEQGLAVLQAPAQNHPDGPVWLITAELNDDLCYLLPQNRPWVIEEVDQSGRKAPVTYDVMLYPDRGVYRPGETVHLTGLVRDAAGRTPPPFPLRVQVTRPDGRSAGEMTVTPMDNGQGVFQTEFTSAADARTGRYRFSVHLPGAEDSLGQTTALVETFVPIRIEVKAAPDKPRFGPGDEPKIKVAARYLFDQPGAGLPVTVFGSYAPTGFQSTRFKGYVFGGGATASPVTVEDANLALDELGKIDVSVKGPPKDTKGLWHGSFSVSVNETGGRSVSANVSFLADTIDRHVGLQMPQKRIVSAGATVPIGWVFLSGLDEPVPPGPMEFSLERIEWDWTVQQDSRNGPVWKSVERPIPVKAWKLLGQDAAQSQGRIEINCPEPGRYRLKAVEAASKATTVAEFYAAEGGEESGGALVSRPERLEIVLDRKEYSPGSTAKVLVRAPFPGTMLLTLENDRVLDSRVVQLAEKSTELELPVPAGLRGGAFVTATVVRAVDPDKDKWLPHRAMGLARLSTDRAGHDLPVTIEAPGKIEPGRKVRVTVVAGGPGDPQRPGLVHLWAVDEGILLTTAFRTPHPGEHFFAPRRLEVETSDLFGDLLPDYKRPASIARIGADGGGDDGEAEASRYSPVPLRVRQSAVVWQAFVPVDAEGKAEVEIDVPKLTGELRLMAVAVDQDRYGSAAKPLTVTSPLLVEASWPRFAAPGDEMRVPVKIFNTTDQPMKAELAMKIDGPMTVRAEGGENAQLGPVEIAPGKAATVWLDATAGEAGQVRATIEATALAMGATVKSAGETELTIRPAAPLHSLVRSMKLEAGKSMTVDPPDSLLPGTARSVVSISGRATVDLRPAVERLIDYPYGCVEQTTSRLYSILHAADLIEQDAPQDIRAQHVRSMVDAGIVRLWSMQTRGGGLGYWPGDNHPALWGSTYAAGFLAQARHAGYRIDKRFTDELMRYLQTELNRGGNGDGEAVDDNTRAEICHVLATFGRPPHGWMSHLGERLDRLDMAGRAHLAGAWLEAGRRDLAKAALPDGTAGLTVTPATSGRITSQVTQQAVLLNVLLDLDVDHASIPNLVQKLQAARAAAGCWGSTLENAQSLSALVRYQTATNKDKPEFTGTITLGDGMKNPFDHTKVHVFRFKDQLKPVEIAATGTGNVYVSIQTEGLLRKGRFEAYDRQLQVRRTWKDRAGKPVDFSKLKVGDLVQVEISVTAGARVDNVAIVDALPGGMEVENPRLATSAGSAQSGEGHAPLLPPRLEFLDDRVVLFVSADRQTATYRYCLRAVSAGTFELPPIQASCMYDPTFACVHGGGKIQVGR